MTRDNVSRRDAGGELVIATEDLCPACRAGIDQAERDGTGFTLCGPCGMKVKVEGTPASAWRDFGEGPAS